MPRFRRTIDLLNVSVTGLSQLESAEERAICVMTRKSKISGWYRLKIYSPLGRLRRVGIEAFDANLASVFAFEAIAPGSRFVAAIFLGEIVESLSLRLHLGGKPEFGLSAKLRPISLIEYVWHSLKHKFLRQPAKFLRYFYRPTERAIIQFEFPIPLTVFKKGIYDWWIAERETAAYARMVTSAPVSSGEPPAISILMTVCDPPPICLEKAIKSVRQQTSDHWQLCIADDASKDPKIHRILSDAARSDPRIRLQMRAKRGGISAATNTAFAMATSPFIACLDHDDTLAPIAIEIMAAYLARAPNTKLLYSDSDMIDVSDNRYGPFFKPEFSRDLFYSCNYLNHLTVCHSDAVRKIGGWRSEFDGAQDYDLYLRISETIEDRQIGHVAMILYHWRAVSGSVAMHIGYKPYAEEAGRRALTGHMQRRNIKARVDIVPNMTMYRIRYELADPPPKVSIIIPFRDKPLLLQQCVSSILERSTYQNYEIILIDNGSIEEATLELLRDYRDKAQIRLLHEPGEFNYSALNNRAAKVASGDYLCLLNNDTQVITPDWLEDMVGYASQPGVGCVGGKLYFANGTIQHAGVVTGLGGVAGHVFSGYPADAPGYNGRLQVASNYSAVTGACLMVSREIYWKVGGLDEEHLRVAFNDIDFCLKVRAHGYRNVLTPFVELFHYESLSRGSDESPENAARFEKEGQVLKHRYGEALLADPCYSPHLTLTKGDFSIRED